MILKTLAGCQCFCFLQRRYLMHLSNVKSSMHGSMCAWPRDNRCILQAFGLEARPALSRLFMFNAQTPRATSKCQMHIRPFIVWAAGIQNKAKLRTCQCSASPNESSTSCNNQPEEARQPEEAFKPAAKPVRRRRTPAAQVSPEAAGALPDEVPGPQGFISVPAAGLNPQAHMSSRTPQPLQSPANSRGMKSIAEDGVAAVGTTPAKAATTQTLPWQDWQAILRGEQQPDSSVPPLPSISSIAAGAGLMAPNFTWAPQGEHMVSFEEGQGKLLQASSVWHGRVDSAPVGLRVTRPPGGAARKLPAAPAVLPGSYAEGVAAEELQAAPDGRHRKHAEGGSAQPECVISTATEKPVLSVLGDGLLMDASPAPRRRGPSKAALASVERLLKQGQDGNDGSPDNGHVTGADALQSAAGMPTLGMKLPAWKKRRAELGKLHRGNEAADVVDSLASLLNKALPALPSDNLGETPWQRLADNSSTNGTSLALHSESPDATSKGQAEAPRRRPRKVSSNPAADDQVPYAGPEQVPAAAEHSAPPRAGRSRKLTTGAPGVTPRKRVARKPTVQAAPLVLIDTFADAPAAAPRKRAARKKAVEGASLELTDMFAVAAAAAPRKRVTRKKAVLTDMLAIGSGSAGHHADSTAAVEHRSAASGFRLVAEEQAGSTETGFVLVTEEQSGSTATGFVLVTEEQSGSTETGFVLVAEEQSSVHCRTASRSALIAEEQTGSTTTGFVPVTEELSAERVDTSAAPVLAADEPILGRPSASVGVRDDATKSGTAAQHDNNEDASSRGGHSRMAHLRPIRSSPLAQPQPSGTWEVREATVVSTARLWNEYPSSWVSPDEYKAQGRARMAQLSHQLWHCTRPKPGAVGQQQYKVFVFDLETTGVAKWARITDMCFMCWSTGAVFSTLVNPLVEIPPGTSAITGITNEMVQNAPKIYKAANALAEWLLQQLQDGSRPVFVAHNGYHFDLPLLTNQLAHAGFALPPDWLYLDTLHWSRHIWMDPSAGSSSKYLSSCPKKYADGKARNSFSLATLCAHFGISSEGHHRAEADVKMLKRVLDELIDIRSVLPVTMPSLMPAKGSKMDMSKEHAATGSRPAASPALDAAVEQGDGANGNSIFMPQPGQSTEQQRMSCLELVLEGATTYAGELSAVIGKLMDDASCKRWVPEVYAVGPWAQAPGTCAKLAEKAAETLEKYSSPPQEQLWSEQATAVAKAATARQGHVSLAAATRVSTATVAVAAEQQLQEAGLLEGLVPLSDADAGESEVEEEGLAAVLPAWRLHDPVAEIEAGGEDAGDELDPADVEQLLKSLEADASAAWAPCISPWEHVKQLVKPTRTHSKDLTELNFPNLVQLLWQFPKDYIQYRSVPEQGLEEQYVLCPARIKELSHKKVWGRDLSFMEIKLSLPAPWAPGGQLVVEGKDVKKGYGSYLHETMKKKHAVGSQPILRGKLVKDMKTGQLQLGDYMLHLHEEVPPQYLATNPILPVYAQRNDVKPDRIASLIGRCLGALNGQPGGEDPLPASLVSQHSLLSWQRAIQAVHLPASWEERDQGVRRLAFQEFFLQQMHHLLRRRNRVGGPPAAVVADLRAMEAATAALTFRLTSAQERVMKEIVDDMASPRPMFRLLQGDVGSGKTAVAFLALLAVTGSGAQGALMAPTEILAIQHYRKLQRLVDAMPESLRPAVELLTGSTSTKARRRILEGLETGEVSILVGTHSLLFLDDEDSTSTVWQRLGLVVVDEQQRWGVKQRAKLANVQKEIRPHVLYMTATPIPRTLAMVVHGDMVLSALDELPPGRKPIPTKALPDNKTARKELLKTIKQEVADGGRAFIVCPLIEESESDRLKDVRAAEVVYEELQSSEVLQGISIDCLHGRMAPDKRDAALSAFRDGRTQVLVATAVIEVGVDVPDASLMVVEGADRFGLSQLHQLRGRVGRGDRASSCFLVASKRAGPQAIERLRALERSQNGFEVAEADLQQRGPGDMMSGGTRQSGRYAVSDLAMGRLQQEPHLMEAARTAAAQVLSPGSLEPRLIAALQAFNLHKVEDSSDTVVG